jgi:hypothetical protein
LAITKSVLGDHQQRLVIDKSVFVYVYVYADCGLGSFWDGRWMLLVSA